MEGVSNKVSCTEAKLSEKTVSLDIELLKSHDSQTVERMMEDSTSLICYLLFCWAVATILAVWLWKYSNL